MTLDYHMKRIRIDNLIVRALSSETSGLGLGLGFNAILREIHTYQEKTPKKYRTQLSRKTLTQHLTLLIKNGIVCKKTGKTKKRKVYALTEKSDAFIFANILIEIAELKNTLDFFDRKPFFSFFESGSKPQAEVLAEMRDALKQISERLNSYLRASA